MVRVCCPYCGKGMQLDIIDENGMFRYVCLTCGSFSPVYNTSSYCKQWHCWAIKPTDEERQKTEWIE